MKSKSLMMMCLRGATLGSKFLLVMVLAKYASYDILANYTLIAITISFLLYFLGFDFYTFASREIIKKGFSKSARYLLNQFVLYAYMYLIAVPFVYGLNYFNVLNVGFLFYFVLITEHLAQEGMRVLVINNKPIKANFQLFLRSSLWIYIYIVYSYTSNYYSLTYLLLLWLISNFFAILFSLTELKFIEHVDKDIKVDWQWIRHGMSIALPLLIATLMLRGVYISDRYILKYTASTEVLAIYSFFSNMSNALIAFIDAAVIMTFYPKLIAAYNQTDSLIYESTLRAFKQNVMKIGFLVSFILSIAIPLICLFLDKKEFIHSIAIFYILLLSAFVYSYGLVFHYELYARGKDLILLICTCIAFICGLIVEYIFAIFYNSIGMSLAILFVSTLLLITKSYAVGKIKNKK